MCKGLLRRDWGKLVWKKIFFSSGRQEDQETPVTLLQSFSPSTLLPKSMSGQRTSQLSLPSHWELPGRHKESHRQYWAPKLVSGPPSPGRVVCEENKENPACLGSWKSEDDFHIRVPGKPNDSLLSSQLAAGLFFLVWELTSAQQLEHQPRLEEVEDMHLPTSPQAHSTTLSTRAERDTWEASH